MCAGRRRPAEDLHLEEAVLAALGERRRQVALRQRQGHAVSSGSTRDVMHDFDLTAAGMGEVIDVSGIDAPPC